MTARFKNFNISTRISNRSGAINVRNILLGDPGLGGYLRLTPAQIISELRQLVAEAEETITQVTQADVPNTWAACFAPLNDVHDRLGQVWGRIEQLQMVMDSPRWRRVTAVGQKLMVAYWTKYQQHQVLYEKYHRLRQSTGYRQLSMTRRRVIDLTLRDFKLVGAHLPVTTRRRIGTINTRLAKLTTEFAHRLLDATNAGMVWTTNGVDTIGIPKNVVSQARHRAQKVKRTGWGFSIQAPEYQSLMRTAVSRDLRRRLYHQAVSRAAEFGPVRHDNTPIMTQILAERLSLAKLLGFRSYAELSLSKKMAATPARAIKFAARIATSAKHKAQHEARDLKKFALTQGIQKMQAWDVDYLIEKIRVNRFGFNQEDLRPFFPHPAVLAVLAEMIYRVFGMRLRRARIDHPYRPDLLAYNLIDGCRVIRGQVIFDLFARAEKRSGAWMDQDTTRRWVGRRHRMPVARCTCNFPLPDRHGVAWLTHDDIHTLWHEMGHVLHLLLTEVDEPDVGGTRGVEWDAVESPSQWFQRFAWEPAMFAALVRHGAKKIPAKKLQRLLESEKFMSGLRILRQTQQTLFDLRLYQQPRPTKSTSLHVWRQILKQYGVLPVTSDNRFPNSFSHVFDGGYAAGYYSYLWAEVMAADAYEPLRRQPSAWRRWGKLFQQEILAVGGSRPAAQSFRAYRRRDPIERPLLRGYGLNRS